MWLCAGCAGDSENVGSPVDTESPDPTQTPSPTSTKTPSTMTLIGYRSKYAEKFIRLILEEGIEIQDMWEDGKPSESFLLYVTQASTDEGLLREMTTIAGAFASQIEEGWTTMILRAEINDDIGPIGRYQIKDEWAEQYTQDEISVEKYMEKIVDTLDEV